MRIGARNQLRGTVKSVKLGNVMAEVVVDIGGSDMVSAVTRGAAEQLELTPGKQVTLVVKATEVMLAVDDTDGSRDS